VSNSAPVKRKLSTHLQLGRVDELEVVNKEMYSSRLKDFSVKVRALYSLLQRTHGTHIHNTRTYLHIHSVSHTHTHTHTYTHIHTHIHLHTLIYIHTYTQTHRGGSCTRAKTVHRQTTPVGLRQTIGRCWGSSLQPIARARRSSRFLRSAASGMCVMKMYFCHVHLSS
jgi:hypothetical protein